MSDPRDNKKSETGAELARGVFLIVLAGAVVGLGYNAMQQRANPSKALPWIRQETTLGSLESYQGTSPTATSADSPPAGAGEANAGEISSPGRTAPADAPRPSGATGPATTPSRAATSGRSPAEHPSAGTPAAPARTPKVPVTTEPPAQQPQTAATPTTQAQAPPGGMQTNPPSASTQAPPAVDLPFVPDSREPLEMQIDNVKKFFDAGAAVLVDARSTEEYTDGHIPGALSLPFDDVYKDEARLKQFDSGGKPIIVYCGGGDCELSKSLAASLVDVGGKKKVLVFTGGITDWQKAGYPLVKGAPGGTH